MSKFVLSVTLFILMTLNVVKSSQAEVVKDFDDVIVKVKAIEVVDGEGNRQYKKLRAPVELSLPGLNSDALVFIIDFDPGVYEEIDFHVDAERGTHESTVIIDGQAHSLYIASGVVSLQGVFEIDEQGEFDFTTKDTRISAPAGPFGDFKLLPVIQLMDLKNP